MTTTVPDVGQVRLSVAQSHDVVYSFVPVSIAYSVHTYHAVISGVQGAEVVSGAQGVRQVWNAVKDGTPILLEDEYGHRAWMVVPVEHVFAVSAVEHVADA